MEELVSVIVPVYNSEKYLKQCIESIINQTYKNLEIIIIDDESTDKSGEICDEYKKIDYRIQVIHKKNEGVSIARNYGIHISKGKYIAFVDSDDYIEENMIKELVGNIIEFDAEVSICGYKILYEKSNNVKLSDNKNVTVKLSSRETLEMIFNSNKINGFLWNKIFQRKILKERLLREDIDICEDLLLVCEILNDIQNVCYTSKQLYNYRNSEISVTLNPNKIYEKNGKCKYSTAYEEILKIIKYDKDIKDIIKLREIKTILESYYIIIRSNYKSKKINEYTFKFLKENLVFYLLNRKNKIKYKVIFSIMISFIGMQNLMFRLKYRR